MKDQDDTNLSPLQTSTMDELVTELARRCECLVVCWVPLVNPQRMSFRYWGPRAYSVGLLTLALKSSTDDAVPPPPGPGPAEEDLEDGDETEGG